ncbi:hypothetical protein IEQ34_019981 [Dendrobium chrysotoxum]|uniref:Uncharacterized protein n=1 Tax=Dendrobium chrysotoxum TaxID=161865 RepID=A0AAV7G8S9_DENCH|nr:hypothetical protein IEQ34_019981 [Dendrobium chrysotoxum]
MKSPQGKKWKRCAKEEEGQEITLRYSHHLFIPHRPKAIRTDHPHHKVLRTALPVPIRSIVSARATPIASASLSICDYKVPSSCLPRTPTCSIPHALSPIHPNITFSLKTRPLTLLCSTLLCSTTKTLIKATRTRGKMSSTSNHNDDKIVETVMVGRYTEIANEGDKKTTKSHLSSLLWYSGSDAWFSCASN